MSRGPDAATRLERALIASAERAGCPISILRWVVTRWASATFAGARHQFVLEGAAGTAIEEWLTGLPEAEFALAGHLVADLSVEAVRRADGGVSAEVEALTIEER
ncbi:hypothetical protein ACFQ1E_08695 [Sphingomonas canadensis]|uniref:Uncharacterized protein n=1 Tax=Sphingomonas canadensis TaxID=1219257 RepID=A0ABW3H6H6_9SPHN|nr:hypothetical protein [Sphingomonas canadensis]MCW3836117.1 hypothetical protein [Sphingomonas canadensis]